MPYTGLPFNMTNHDEPMIGLSGGDRMNNESDNIDGTVGDENNETDDFCEECCCFEIEDCEFLHSQGCKVDTTCCW